MPIYEITAPNGKTYEIKTPEGVTKEQAAHALLQNNPFVAIPAQTKPKEATTGFGPAFSSSVERLKGELGLLGGKLGFMSPAEAEAYQKAKEETAQKIFTGSEWSSPGTKLLELFGGSVPYMAAPLVAGAAAASAPVSGALGLGTLAAGALGAGVASATQFTASNLAEQMKTGKKLEETSGGAAVAAAIPQALLDVGAQLLMPGIGRMLGRAGAQVTEEAAAKLAQQTFLQKAGDYALRTGRASTVEGTTEATQEVLAKLQAGQNIADPEARADYIENFLGGAVMGAVLGPFGRAADRGRIIREGRALTAAREGKEAEERRAQELAAAPQQLTELEAAQAQLRAQFGQTSDPAEIRSIIEQGTAQAKEIKRLRSLLSMPEPEAEVEADPDLQKRIQKLQTKLANAQRQGNFNAAAKLLAKLSELKGTPISPLEDQGAPGEVAPEVAAPAPFTAPAAEAAETAEATTEEAPPAVEGAAPTVRTRRAKKGAAPVAEVPAVEVPTAEVPTAEVPAAEVPAVVAPAAPPVGEVKTTTPMPEVPAPIEAAPTTPPAAIEQGVLFTEPRAPKLTPQREQAIQFWEEQNDGRDLHIPFDRLSPKRQASWIRDTELGRASPNTHARVVRLQLEEDRKYGPAGPKVSSEFGGPAFEPAAAPARVKGIENLLGMAQRSNKLGAADRQVLDHIEAYLPDILASKPETRETPLVGGETAKVAVDLKNDVYTWLRDTLSGRDRTDLGANILGELRGVAASKTSEFQPKVQYESTKLTPEQADFLKGTEQELSTPTPPTEPRTTGELTGRTGRTVAMERQAAEEGRTTPMPKVVPGGREVVQGELFAAPERETAFSTAKEFKDYLAGDALSDLRKAQLGDKVPPTAARVQKDLAPLKEELGKLEGVLSGLAAQKRLIEAGGAAAEQRLAGQRAALSQRRNTLEEGILGRVRRLVAQEKAVADQISAAQAESARINRWVEQNARIFEMKFAGAAPDTAIEEYLVEDAKLEDQLAAWEEHANELAGIRKDALGRIDKWLNTPKNKPVVTALREEIASIDTQMAALDKARAEQAARTTQEVSAAREFLRAPQRRASELREKIGKAEGAVSERARTAAQAANVAQEKQAEETVEKVKAARRQETERFEKAKGLREQLPGQRVDAKKAREVLNRMDDLVATATSSRQEAFDRASARKELSEEFGDKDAAALMAAWSKATRPTTEEQAEIDAAKQADAEAKPQDKAAAKDRLKALNNTIGKRMDASLAEYETLKRRIIEVYYAPKGQKAAAGVAKHTSALKEQQAQLATIEQELESKVNAESGKKLNSRQVAAREKKKAALGEAIAETEVKLAKSTAKRAKARNIKIEQLTPTKASPAAVRAAMNTLSPDEYQAIKAAPDYETFVDQNPDLKVNKTVFNIAKTQIGREAAPLVRKGTTAGVIRGVSEEQRTAGAAAKIVKGEVAGLTAGPAQAPTKGRSVSKVQQARAATGKRAVTKKDIAEANKLAEKWKRLAEGVEEGEAERVAAAKGTEWQGFGGQRGDIVDIDKVDDYLDLDSLPDARLIEGYASRATQELDADTAAALERGETVAALESLAQNGSTDFVRTLAQRLRDVIGDTTKVKLVDGLEVDGQAAEGLYDAAKRLIELDRNSMTEETLTHEGTHAATVQTLDAYEKEKAGAGGMQMTRRQFLKGAAAAVGSMQLPKIPLSTSVEQRMQLFMAAQDAFNSWMSSAAKLLPLSARRNFEETDFALEAAYKNDKSLGRLFELEEQGGFVDEDHYADSIRGLLEEDSKFLERAYKTFYDARQAAVDAISKQATAEKPFQLTAEQRRAAEELDKLYQSMKKQGGLADEYGMTNLKEFASEIMSNKDLRARLDQTEGLLKRIYNAFLRLIGFDPKTVSEMAVDNVYKLFAPNTSTSNTERMASLVRGTFFNTGPKFAAGTPESVMNAANDIVGRRAGLGDRAVAAASGLLWRTKTVDRWAPAELLIKQGVAKGKLTEAQALQTRINMRMLEQRSQLVGTAVVDGVPQLSTADKYGGIRLVEGREGANLRKVLDALKDSGVGDSRATEEMFSAWMAVLRSENEGIGLAKLNYDLDPAKAATIKAYVDANPKIRNAFEKARAIYKEYNRDLLTLLVDTGVMERSKMEQLLEGDFVPYYRVDNKTGMVRLELGPTKTFDIGNVLKQPELKELVGGDQKILPIFDGAVRNTAMLIGMATKNLQTREVAFMLKQLGLGEIRKGEGPEFSPRFKIDGALKHIAIDPDAFPEGIPAALLIEGLQGIQAAMPGIVKLMGVPAQFLRKWVMRTPLYPLRQVIRDSAHAWLTTGGNFAPVLSSFAEFGRMVTGTSNVEQILQRSGVISSNVYTGDTGDYVKLLRDMKTTSTFGIALAKLDAIAQQGDAATRAVVYDSFRKQGMSHPEALLNTLESMNFSRRGTSSSLHWLSSMIPFFHSSLQGLDAVYRSFKGDTSFEGKMNARSSLLKRGLLLSGMTIAYAAMMQDDEAYKNATPDQRLMNWFIRVPGLSEPIRVPIPFELGLIFKSIPETIINVAFGDTKAKDALKALGQQALRSLPGGEAPIPTAIKPVLEVAMNHSLFSDQPVESMRERGLDVSERYRVNTTGLAKALGQLGVISPVQIEHLIRGYTGNLFLHMSSVVDVLLRPTTPDAAKQPARNLSELPLVGGLFQPNTARGVIDQVFKEVEKSQQAKRTYDRLREEGRDDEAEKYANQFGMRIALNSTGGRYRQKMGEFAAQRRAIAASDATPEEKRQQMNDLRKIEIEYASAIKDIFSEAE